MKTAGANRWNVCTQVSAWQTIQWMRDPQPIERAEAFPPFQCDYKVLHHFFATSCISNNVLKDISARHVNWSFKQALHRELAEHIHRWRPPAARGPHTPLGARFSNTGFHQKWHLGKIQQKCLTNEPTWKENTKRNTDLREIQREIQIQRNTKRYTNTKRNTNTIVQERPPRCDKPKVCNLWHKSGVR